MIKSTKHHGQKVVPAAIGIFKGGCPKVRGPARRPETHRAGADRPAELADVPIFHLEIITSAIKISHSVECPLEISAFPGAVLFREHDYLFAEVISQPAPKYWGWQW